LPATAAPRPQPAAKKQLASVEGRMQKLSALIARIDAALADGTAFVTEPKRAKLLAKQRSELEAALAQVETEWLEVSEAAE
ncbi:MAG: ABC transporter ATP-binding protein, partial [Hyphomicrobiales bacterium]|nr:ABC transporter ATP-binding protein [Hyphomicrobiales bacterium]